ncbi:MAG: energy transducer TonB [Burkholderiaceae bacterium]|nr:energy transducer TonB [Burkholderiaceae bacterium]
MKNIILLILMKGLLLCGLSGCAQHQLSMFGLTRPGIDENAKVCPQPKYPRAALKTGATGITTISFMVDAAGRVSEAAILQKSGNTAEHVLLDEEALKTIKACRFSEAKGYPPSRVVQSFRWKIEE